MHLHPGATLQSRLVSCRVAVLLVAGLLASACSFDGGSSVTPRSGSDASGVGGPDDDVEPVDAAPDAEVPDAGEPDAMVVCVDMDGDGALAGDPSCAEVLDCNDTDPNVYPGQSDFFEEPMATGSFDYNCDGRGEVVADDVYDDCGFRGFSCRGDGWKDQAPLCGQQGTFVECGVVGFSCTETDEDLAIQACR